MRLTWTEETDHGDEEQLHLGAGVGWDGQSAEPRGLVLPRRHVEGGMVDELLGVRGRRRGGGGLGGLFDIAHGC